jgi:hypothetical protein
LRKKIVSQRGHAGRSTVPMVRASVLLPQVGQ